MSNDIKKQMLADLKEIAADYAFGFSESYNPEQFWWFPKRDKKPNYQSKDWTHENPCRNMSFRDILEALRITYESGNIQDLKVEPANCNNICDQ